MDDTEFVKAGAVRVEDNAIPVQPLGVADDDPTAIRGLGPK